MRRYGESIQHERAKEKVAQVLRDKGFTVFIDCYAFECQTDKGDRTYWPDVYAQNFCLSSTAFHQRMADKTIQRGGRRIIVEIQGPGSHHSTLAFGKDRNRIKDIREAHGQDIEYYTVMVCKRIGPLDIRSWTEADICEHLNIAGS